MPALDLPGHSDVGLAPDGLADGVVTTRCDPVPLLLPGGIR